MVQAVRDNTKYLLYALANSNAMNGLNETSKVVQTMTWWRAAYLGGAGVTGVLTLLFVVLYAMALRKEKKGEEKA